MYLKNGVFYLVFNCYSTCGYKLQEISWIVLKLFCFSSIWRIFNLEIGSFLLSPIIVSSNQFFVSIYHCIAFYYILLLPTFYDTEPSTTRTGSYCSQWILFVHFGHILAMKLLLSCKHIKREGERADDTEKTGLALLVNRDIFIWLHPLVIRIYSTRKNKLIKHIEFICSLVCCTFHAASCFVRGICNDFRLPIHKYLIVLIYASVYW